MPFKHNSLLNKLIHICLIFTLLSAWFYTGRPRLEHLNFPPAPQTARAAIAFDAASEGNTGSAGSGSLTVSHTIGAAGTNRILMVGVNIFSTTSPMPTVTVLKYANVDMTFIDAQENTVDSVRIRSELWYIKAPTTGANNIAITFSESVQGVAGGMSYTGVDQTTPLGAAAKAGGTSSTASVAVSSATGELVVDTVGARQNSGGTLTLTQVANQTERYNDTSGTNGNSNVVGAGSEEAGAGTVTMSWTISSSARWAIVAVPIKPSATNRITVSTGLAQPANVTETATDQVIGAFTMIATSTGMTVSSIKISETGTVVADTKLTNVELWAQEEATCTFSGSSQIGSTLGSFDASDEGTFSSLSLSIGATTQQCVFVVLDVASDAGGSNTIEIEITSSSGVTASGGTVAASFPAQLSGATTIRADQGILTTPEVDFDWVPGRSTWGQVIWSTTETEGDIKLKVYYTATNPCDTIVPNSALAGNSSGYDISASPLNISGLNTATYNRICLRGELTAGSTVSPTLNDWKITWVAYTGDFNVYASSTVSFNSPLAVAFTSQTSTLSNVGAVKMVDDRGSSAGWTVNLAGNDWKSGQDVMQLDYNSTGSNDNLGKLCAFPNNGTLYAESGSLTGVSKGSNDCFSATVEAIDMVTASAGNGNGVYWLTDLSLSQYIPGNPTAQVYTTTVVFTLQ